MTYYFMTKRERVMQALQHKETDITPYHIDFTSPIREKLVEYYHNEEIDTVVDNHFLTLLQAGFKWKEIKPGFWQDPFGVVWDRRIDTDIGNPTEYLLSDKNNLDKYRFPEVKPELFSHIPALIEKNQELFIFFAIGFSLFERAWTLRGMENLMLDMVTDPGYTETLLDRIVEFNLKIIEQATLFPIQIFYFGDDWGQQRGLLMGPKYWRRYIKPRLARMYQKVKEKGLFVSIHSCGDIEEIGAGDGYVLSPAHATPKDVPLANVLAMIETLQNQ